MPVHNHITDPATGQEAGVHKPVNLGFPNPAGIVAYTEPRKQWNPVLRYFQAESGAVDMNVDASGTGTDENVHDGGDTVYWTATALSGTWDFASTTQANGGTQSVDATATTNNDEAQFEDGTTTDMSSFDSLSGFIYITSWPGSGTKEVRLRARLAGVDVGSEVDLSNYMSTGTQNTWQSFTVPKADMGLGAQTIDQLIVKTVDIGGGQPPNYYLDDLKWDGTPGSAMPVTYKIEALPGVNTFAVGFGFFFVDAVAEADALAYDSILGVPALTDGILFTRQSQGEIEFAAPFRQFSDFIETFGQITVQTGGDATNRWVKIESIFNPQIRLFDDDFFSMVVQDDLSGLLRMRASMRLIEEIPNE